MSAEDEERIEDAARKVGVDGLMSRSVTSLSGGEAQRVAIACVLAQDTPILLLDEPASALDPGQAARVFAMLRRLASEGRTVVAVIHDINEARALRATQPRLGGQDPRRGQDPHGGRDRYMALSGGVVVSEGPSEELDEDVLMELYGTSFMSHYSETGDVMWRAMAGWQS